MSDWAQAAIELLSKGFPVTIVPRGHSMEPLVRDGETVHLTPVAADAVTPGDIVLCRVRGCSYLHKVIATAHGRALIGNNRGHTNGWTSTVYGKVRRE